MLEDWLSFGHAVAEIVERRGVSQGAAQRALREALASGDIQSRRAPFEQQGAAAVLLGPWEQIRPEQWREASIDLTDDLVDVYVPDFRVWLGKSKSMPKKRGRPPKLDWEGEIKRQVFALLEYYGAPNPIDPERGTQAAIEKDIKDELQRDRITVAESTVREHVSGFISEWKAKKAEKAEN